MFAICCAIAPTAELKDRILKLSQDYTHGPADLYVFVDDLSRVYDKADELGYNTDSTSAPFAGKTPYECSLILKEIREKDASNEVDELMFAIIDERSLGDGTLLLVEEPEEENGGRSSSVRAVFEMAESQLCLWVAGKTTISEAIEKAQATKDGVLRPGMDM